MDHGSPSARVNAVRARLRDELAAALGARAATVVAASMERRPGAAYDFNEPLLEGLLASPGWADGGGGDVVVALAFLSPGRHAGAGGDIDEILAAARAACPGLRTHTTPLLASHPLVTSVLCDRVAAADAAPPTHPAGEGAAGASTLRT